MEVIQLKLETPLTDSYLRTRNNNLRCFPKCSPFHMEQRFCGRGLELSVTGVSKEKVNNSIIFIEFRNRRTDPTFKIGDACSKTRLDDISGKIVHAELVKCVGEEQFKFAVPPPRKWHYPGKLHPSDLHLVQLYLACNNVVIAMAESTHFHVVPIWKSEDGTSNADAADNAGSSPNLNKIHTLEKHSSSSDLTKKPVKGTNNSNPKIRIVERKEESKKKMKEAQTEDNTNYLETIETPPSRLRSLEQHSAGQKSVPSHSELRSNGQIFPSFPMQIPPNMISHTSVRNLATLSQPSSNARQSLMNPLMMDPYHRNYGGVMDVNFSAGLANGNLQYPFPPIVFPMPTSTFPQNNLLGQGLPPNTKSASPSSNLPLPQYSGLPSNQNPFFMNKNVEMLYRNFTS